MKNNIREYVFWVAIVSIIGMALLDFGVVESLDRYEQYADKILYILALAGVINNRKKGDEE